MTPRKSKNKEWLTSPGKMPSALWEGHIEWPECEVIAKPVKKASEPRVLVRRRDGQLFSPRGEELHYLPGEPVISLFTGAGGMDLGIEQAGMCSVLQHEWDQFCCETLIANRPQAFRHAALIQGDIYNTPTEMILKEAGLRVGEATIVCGGPPCQGFSTSGKRSPTDPRNDLVFEFLRVVRETKPRFFIFENVRGFLSLNKGEYFKAFLSTAYGCFYELVYGLLDACHYGVPQHRVRFICMGTRRDLAHCDGILGSLPEMTNFHRSDLKLIVDPDAPLFKTSRAARAHAPGIRYFPDREILVPPSPTNGLDDPISDSYFRFYERLERDEPDRVVFAPREYSA